MDTSTFTYIFRNITGTSYDYADAVWFSLSDAEKCSPMSGFYQGRAFIRRTRN